MINNKLIYGFLILFVGFAMSLNTATAQVTGEQEIQTQMENQIQGEVVDAETGEALSDVTVEIEGMNKEATTDEDGKFTFENLESLPQTGTEEGGMGEQRNMNELTFTIDHDDYEQFSKTLSMDEIRQNLGQQGQTGQQSQQVEQREQSDNNPLKFKLQPKDKEDGDDY